MVSGSNIKLWKPKNIFNYWIKHGLLKLKYALKDISWVEQQWIGERIL